MLGRRKVLIKRDIVANQHIREARLRAKRELTAMYLQKIWHAYKARIRVTELRYWREISRDREALVKRSMRVIQRIAHGKLGRMKFRVREAEVALFELQFQKARDCQRVFRGHVGRTYAEAVRREKFRVLRNRMATEIQRVYRGGRGRILASITRALTELREKNQWYAREIQRCMRGKMTRNHLMGAKEEKERIRIRSVMSQRIQRIFRGHKGREACELERELQIMEQLAAPLFLRLKEEEEVFQKQARLVRQLAYKDELREENLRQVESHEHTIDFSHVIQSMLL
jgi:hypothetical protein